ncbi:hypothetical protein LY90DRAFT_124846 [Neocallimastix californiae]|uniref:Ankyrin n=1 Tax=Neocallimastix californiae TaxID=1754190 RepID=A0A1Y2AKR8_9FUNG|nr:hypothetical protein LY90DRAFT_124846 [Neocallimastix californiae]|eukprot:ORY23159.1 hypothetical protein LY90DRAFT_124846 [Neocallimastix californiae]
MDSEIEIKKKEILNIIKENDLKTLKNFCDDNNVFSNKKNYFQDLLSIALAENTIPDIVEFIVKHSNGNLNYKCKIHSIYATPLYFAIGHNNFEVADILLRYKADINFGITIEVTYYSLMEWLLMYNQLNRRNLSYILKHGYIFRKPTTILNYLLDRKENKMLEMILRYLRFNHDTILRILTFHGKPVSSKQLLDMLSMNNNKYDITEEMYATAIEKGNLSALKLLFEYENNTESKILQRIIKYDLLNKLIPLNHYHLVKNILVRYDWNYRCVNYRSIFYYALNHFCNKIVFAEMKVRGRVRVSLIIN